MIDGTRSLTLPSIPDTATKRHKSWVVLGACLGLAVFAGTRATLGGTGSPMSTVPAAATDENIQHTVQLMTEPTKQPYPVFCSVGGTSGPSFVEAINFTNAAPPQDSMTIGVSFRSSFVGSYQVIVGWETDGHRKGSTELRLTKAGNLEYGEFATGWHSVIVLPPTNFADGAWHSAVVVRNKSSSAFVEGDLLVSLYADGKLAGRGVLPKRTPEDLLHGAMSARPHHQDYVFQGSIRDLRIYDRALGHQHVLRTSDDYCPQNMLESVALTISSSLMYGEDGS